MTTREFTCVLCGRRFERMSADMILPETTVCDVCLAELGSQDEVALRAEIARRVAERTSPETLDPA